MKTIVVLILVSLVLMFASLGLAVSMLRGREIEPSSRFESHRTQCPDIEINDISEDSCIYEIEEEKIYSPVKKIKVKGQEEIIEKKVQEIKLNSNIKLQCLESQIHQINDKIDYLICTQNVQEELNSCCDQECEPLLYCIPYEKEESHLCSEQEYECNEEIEEDYGLEVPFFSGVGFYSAALYWRPTYSGILYASIAPQPLQSKEVAPNYDWGYKVGAYLNFFGDCFYVEGNYYLYQQDAFDSVSSPGNVIPIYAPALIDNFDFGSGNIQSKYRTVHITLGYKWLCSRRWESHLFAGAKHVRIKEKEMFLYLDPGEFVPANQRLIVNGWGPRMGGNFSLFPFSNCSFLGNIGVQGELGIASLFVNESLSVQSLSNAFTQGSIDFSSMSKIIVGIDFKLQLEYSICIWCLNISALGGYELHNYQNARRMITATNTIGAPPRTISSLGYGGPFAGISINY